MVMGCGATLANATLADLAHATLPRLTRAAMSLVDPMGPRLEPSPPIESRLENRARRDAVPPPVE
eukprot:5299380-Prymnesium_polylepis.1